MKKDRQKTGFTLVEVLVSTAIAAIAFAAIFSALISFNTSLAATTHYRNMHTRARHAMDVISKDLVAAESVSDFTSPDEITLDLYSTNSSPTVEYRLNNEVIERNFNGAGWTSVASNGVQSLEFTFFGTNGTTSASYPSACFVGVIIQMEEEGVHQTYNDVLQARYRLRNK